MARKDGKDRGIVEKPKGSGKWWVRLYVNGREQWHRCDNKSQAKTLYGRLRAEIREGIYFPEKTAVRQDVTLRTWIGRYLDGCTNRGIANERRYGRRWTLLLGKRLLSDITTEELRRIQAKMKARAEGQARQDRHKRGAFSHATINRHFAFLRHVLMLAVKDGKLTRNPVSAITFLPEAGRTRYLSDTELRQLQRTLCPRDWNVVAFAIETGLRRAEQFTLRWEQVDLEAGTLTLPLSKGGKTRHVPLSEGAKTILRSLDSLVTGSPWVFPSPKNSLKPWNAQSFVNHQYLPALRRAGITGAYWHSLRHTAASRRVMDGVDLVTVKEILGHRDIQTTYRYAHLSPHHLRGAVNRGSVVGTGSETGSEAQCQRVHSTTTSLEGTDREGEKGWLGLLDDFRNCQLLPPPGLTESLAELMPA